MRFVIAGGSGFLGSHLIDHLRGDGHEVTQLVRRTPEGPLESQWHPDRGGVDADLVGAADVVVNVAGSRLFGNPHSQKWRQQMTESRVTTTRVLAEAIAKAERPPAFVAANGSSYYGDHGAAPVTEESESRGDAFMTRLTRQWEEATEPAAAAGARVCILRTAPVMARGGDTMRILVPMFKLGLGARLGDGSQYFPIVSLRDWVGVAAFAALHEELAGPVNVCCPETPTNAEFTRAFARLVGRPAFLFAPSPLLRLAGPAAPELLRSLNLRPEAATSAGYEFSDRDVTSVLASGLS
jgi:uncharacterized protein (TIGR01777 family)